MANAKLHQLFGKYFKTPNEYKDVLNGEIQSVNINHANKFLMVTVSFDEIISKQTLHEVQDIIKMGIEINRVKISPRYSSNLFSKNYITEIVRELQNRGKLINGFLDKCTATYKDNILTIFLENGGYELLKRGMTDVEIVKIIKEEFSLDVSVKFDGVLALSDNSEEFKAIEKITSEVDYVKEQEPMPTTPAIPRDEMEIVQFQICLLLMELMRKF
ncbi:MAG: hypothetical protein IJC83_05075 [Oscillospiraceae bacterium]|nr:hypothetical protein [Oscillospiraceae bacterium]